MNKPSVDPAFTFDHVAYSPSPPIVFAVVDFEGGGRLPIELCDCDAADFSGELLRQFTLQIGDSHDRAVRSETAHDRSADTASATCDQGASAMESAARCLRHSAPREARRAHQNPHTPRTGTGRRTGSLGARR